jgi:type I restriction enzyme S subunit
MIAAEVQNIKVSWLSDIPSHWNVVRLKTIVKGGTNGVWGSEPKNNKNDIICVRVADIDEWQYGISQSDLTRRNISDTDQIGRLLKYGDLIIEKSGGGEISPVGRVVIFNLNEKAVTSNFMARLNVIGDINKEFLYYYFRFLYHRRLNHPAIKATTGIQNLDLYAYLQNPIPIPTPKEQTEIVSFINHTSGEITRFIQTKQRFIELLKEQRQSIIDEILNPEQNGWNWLRLKNVATVNDETIGEETDDNFILKYIDIGNVNSNGQIEALQEMLFKNAPSRARRIVRNGDVIISTVRTYLKAITLIASEDKNLIASTGFAVLRAKSDIIPEFLNNVLHTSYFINSVTSNSYGVSYPAITATSLARLKISIPPTIEEQKRIVEHIKTETKTLDIAISKAEREIELIKEYREAMIAEAVTGKMKL